MSAAPDRPQGGASDTPDAPAAGTGLAAVLLAAGEARRMQGINKLLLEIDGVPLVRRSARMLVRAGIEDIVVVLGHQADRVRAALGDPAGIVAGARTRVTVIEHTGYRSGQHGSVLAGLAALPAGCAAALVMLGDMPLVDEADVARIAAAWQRRPQGCAVLVPAFEQRRGNPVLIGPPALAQIVRERPEGGARAWMDAHPQQ
ncbi:MAG TPA: nucleotidyltransferase family protein, partial [Quisquiliibacterium sp.]|nr:nucleotidyltransferase family protein [Quisquiliibacterium sp.]